MENRTFSVSELTNIIKGIFDREPFFSGLMVEGEISNFKRNASGHLYFTLKDEGAQISCVMFKGSTYTLKFSPKDGDKVVIKGSITVYPKSGAYQIYVSEIKEKGIGDLYLKYEELKKKLETKGYFDKTRKKPLPAFPKCIALLTSKTGAVIEDLKSIILKRSQFSNLILYPTKVQGEDAKYSIVKNIALANENDEVDVIILARGGGSIEDLWPFNEEIVADAIYNSKKPIISAIGHETDFTISDFTADLRAATPSDAALIVVKDNKDLKNELDSLSIRLYNSYEGNLEYLKSHLDKLSSSVYLKTPEKILFNFRQNILHLSNKLDLLSPKEMVKNKRNNLDTCVDNLNRVYSHMIDKKNHEYNTLNNKLALLSPLTILNRGYSITYKDELNIKSASEVKIGDTITTVLNDGKIKSKVIE